MQGIQCSPLQVVPLRIYKNANKPNLLRNDSTSSAESSCSVSTTTSIPPALSASSSSSSSASSSSTQHTFGPPLTDLLKARQRHRKRHNSWQISARLAVRAQQTYEAAVSGRQPLEASAVDEARIRLRIALEEEDKCRKKVDDAAFEIMKLKRANEDRIQSQQKLQAEEAASMAGLYSPAFSISSSSSSFGDSPVLPLTPTMPAMAFDLPHFYDDEPEEQGQDEDAEEEPVETHRYSIHLKEVRRLTRMPAKLVHCSCGAACLCSAVSMLLE